MVAEGSNQPPPGSDTSPGPTEAAIRQQLDKILISP
jgi:hypothetical protein